MSQLSELIKACRAGRGEAWIRDFYGGHEEFTDRDVIHDIVWGCVDAGSLYMIQCNVCGRL